MTLKNLQILFISCCWALLVGSGFYGFGNDFYAAYHKSNLAWGGLQNRLGWMLSTFTVYEVHLGVYFVSFLLALSCGMILFKMTQEYLFKKNLGLFFLLYLALLHTWPIIMSTSNAMRQGIAMSFIFVALYHLLSKRYFLYLISIGLMIFSHKSGAFFAALLVATNIYQKWFDDPSKSIFYLRMNSMLLGGALSVSIFVLIFLVLDYHVESRIISGDYRFLFLMINIFYIFIYGKYLVTNSNPVNIFLLFCSFTLPVFLLYGFNWEYERLNMMILILYIASIPEIFTYRDRKYVMLISVILLLFSTFLSGVYESLR